jgi:hypothetical protein
MHHNEPAFSLDNADRADLLCFLVLSHLIGHASTGKWLRTDHVVEAARMWAASNSAECDWLERAKLARMSLELAPQFLVFPWFMDPAAMAKLFADNWQLATGLQIADPARHAGCLRGASVAAPMKGPARGGAQSCGRNRVRHNGDRLASGLPPRACIRLARWQAPARAG